MRWQGRRQSDNVEDRRRSTAGGRPMMMLGGGAGSIVLVIIILLLGGDPRSLLQPPGGTSSNVPLSSEGGEGSERIDDELGQFVSVVLADTEDVWNDLFRRMGKRYREPTLVLFRGKVQTACGFGSAASGPFYCPGDDKLYIDLSFYDELKRRFNAPGDFAQAYVIAHEVGHHVQNLLGKTAWLDAQRGRISEAEYNRLSVRLELQADFYAGVWAHHAQRTKNILDPGDLEEALRAAAAIGDDRIQMQSQGYVVPDSFTHGTSDQRLRWFKKGFTTGDFSQGDTFSLPDP